MPSPAHTASCSMLCVPAMPLAQSVDRLPRCSISGLWVLCWMALSLAAGASDWGSVSIPRAWKTGVGSGRYSKGVFAHWYRCGVRIPGEWRGRQLSIFVEGVDDAREIYVNGHRVGTLGQFPPRYRSGLGHSRRFPIPTEVIRSGEVNTVAVRVYHREGRLGFNVAPPVIFAGEQAIRLEGNWQFRPGDDLKWADGNAVPSEFVFTKTMSAQVAETSLRKLDDDGPLPPAVSLTRFRYPDDLSVEVCLSDPDIAQPLAIRFDSRGRLWLLEYRQYPEPAGLKPVSRDKHLRTVYDKTPLPPPAGARGRDRISIHEDTDGDGRYDRHTVFVDGLNIATSFAIGRGGVWVLNAPYLLFYRDRDGDDRPDGPPEVHLEGFGIEDTHSVVNSLCWGPDGWLYAAQGSTVSGHVRRPGSDDPPIVSMGQLIWRYHPERRRYEIFAEGGGNAFGVEIDAKGRIYSGHNGGNTRGFHYIQGGYYQKGFSKHGSLSNPYAFGYYPFMAHPDVPRFTHAFLIYQGKGLPSRYQEKLFAVAPLQSHVVISERTATGSTFRTRDVGMAFETTDTWVRPVAIAAGPDGAIYVSDFYEQRIDHAAHFQGRVDRTNGRVYRIANRKTQQRIDFTGDLARLPSRELLELLAHADRWHRQTVQRILADRKDNSLAPLLLSRLKAATGQLALEYLWALHHCGGLDDAAVITALGHSDPYVRIWAVRLAADDHDVSAAVAAEFARLAEGEPHIEVRNQLACSSRRLSAELALPIVRRLLSHDDRTDPLQPLALWWALEQHVEGSPEQVLKLFESPEVWQLPLVRDVILERLMRRFAQSGTRADLVRAARLLRLAPDRDGSKILMSGFETAVQGRSLTGLPAELVDAIAAAGGLSLELRLRRGEAAAIATALEQLASAKTPVERAVRLLEILGETRPPQAKPVLLKLATQAEADPRLRSAAIGALQGYADPEIGAALVDVLSQFDPLSQEAAYSLLASRSTWTLALIRAVEDKQIAQDAVPDRFLRRALLQRNEQVAARVRLIWGELEGATTEQMYEQIRKYKQVIVAADGNPYEGKRLYDESCGKCHRLFDEGGRIGPDLTPFQRQDLDRILLNVVNPSAEIREGYETHLVLTADGRTLSGFIEDQDRQIVILKDAEGKRHTIARSEIDEMVTMKRSVMPEKLLDALTPEQVRDLFAYLRSSQPLP